MKTNKKEFFKSAYNQARSMPEIFGRSASNAPFFIQNEFYKYHDSSSYGKLLRKMKIKLGIAQEFHPFEIENFLSWEWMDSVDTNVKFESWLEKNNSSVSLKLSSIYNIRKNIAKHYDERFYKNGN